MFGFSKALANGPKELLQELAKGFRQIGSTDIDRLRASLQGRFNIRSKGLSKSFKYRASDPARADTFSKLFVNEYTGWKAAQIFQTGGAVSGKGKKLTILTDEARNASGRRKFTQSRLRQMIASHEVRFVPTPRGVLIVQDKGGLTKTGKGRKNSRSIILAILVRQIVQKKRINFFENFSANESMHTEILETAIENALVRIAAKK